jgi:hypothetical protein
VRLGRLGTWGRAPGNREVSRLLFLDAGGDLGAACVEAHPEEEGGPWERYASSVDTSEAEPSDG